MPCIGMQTKVLVQELLLQSMDKDTFTVVEQRPTQGFIPADQVLVACST